MLFYQRVDEKKTPTSNESEDEEKEVKREPSHKFDLSKELADWIWKDNTAFLRDKNIFCHNYFGFVDLSFLDYSS